MHGGIRFCFGAASCSFAALVVLECIKYREILHLPVKQGLQGVS